MRLPSGVEILSIGSAALLISAGGDAAFGVPWFGGAAAVWAVGGRGGGRADVRPRCVHRRGDCAARCGPAAADCAGGGRTDPRSGRRRIVRTSGWGRAGCRSSPDLPLRCEARLIGANTGDFHVRRRRNRQAHRPPRPHPGWRRARSRSIRAKLNAILGFVEQLSEVNVEGVEPMTSVTPMRLRRRDDKVTDGGYPEEDRRQRAPDRGQFLHGAWAKASSSR